MAEWLWIDGRVQPAQQPALSGLDRGYLLGEGVFETMAFAQGGIWKGAAHLARMQRGLEGMGLSHPVSLPLFQDILGQLSEAEQLAEGLMRVTITGGSGGRGLIPEYGDAPRVMTAMISPLPSQAAGPLRVRLSGVRRNHRSPAAAWKAVPYLDALLARREVRARGADEAVLCNAADRVCGLDSGNLLVWDGERMRYPGPASGALPGTTLAVLCEGFPLEPADISLEALESATAMYAVRTAGGVRPIGQWEDRPLNSAALPWAAAMRQWLEQSWERDCGVPYPF